jgi:hypothetical protein
MLSKGKLAYRQAAKSVIGGLVGISPPTQATKLRNANRNDWELSALYYVSQPLAVSIFLDPQHDYYNDPQFVNAQIIMSYIWPHGGFPKLMQFRNILHDCGLLLRTYRVLIEDVAKAILARPMSITESRKFAMDLLYGNRAKYGFTPRPGGAK